MYLTNRLLARADSLDNVGILVLEAASLDALFMADGGIGLHEVRCLV